MLKTFERERTGEDGKLYHFERWMSGDGPDTATQTIELVDNEPYQENDSFVYRIAVLGWPVAKAIEMKGK